MQVEGIPLLAAVLLLGASAFVAWEAGASHPARLVAQILVGAGLGGLPAALMFDQCKRWRPDFGFMGLMVGFAIGISFGMLGTAAAGHTGAGRRSWGFFGASVGACVGTFLAFVTVCDQERDLLTEPLVIVLAALLVGSFATLGHQISGGGPSRFSSRAGRADSRSRRDETGHDRASSHDRVNASATAVAWRVNAPASGASRLASRASASRAASILFHS